MQELIQQKYFSIPDHNGLPEIMNQVYDQFREDGFVLLNMEDVSQENFIETMKYFGDIQFHVRSDEEGVVGVKKSEVLKLKGVMDKYSGLDNSWFPPHTDGSYLNGIIKQNDNFHYVGPPAMVALQCESAAKNGGESILVDGKKILADLIENNPDLLGILLQEGCINICRDEQAALNFPLFKYVGNNSWRIRFRSDKMMFCSKWSYKSVRKFMEKYTLNKSYYNYLALESGQILIVDNYRILHGRKAFSVSGSKKDVDKRRMRRIWISETPKNEYKNVNNVMDEHRVFGNFMDYKHSLTNNTTLPFRPGINLTDAESKKCFNFKKIANEKF